MHAAAREPRFLPADDRLSSRPAEPVRLRVADLDGEVAGHVALVPRGLPQTVEVAASALGRSAEGVCVVARLLVSPRARGQRVGWMLLDAAVVEATARGLWPVLDVDTELTAAIALYESAGWTRAGQVTVRFGDGNTLTEYVYLGPRP